MHLFTKKWGRHAGRDAGDWWVGLHGNIPLEVACNCSEKEQLLILHFMQKGKLRGVSPGTRKRLMLKHFIKEEK